MGAGMSKKRQYGFVYRELHRIQRELAAAGVQSEYKRSHLYGFAGENRDKFFNVSFGRLSASNGECCLYPMATIHDESGWKYYQALEWMPGLSWKQAKPRIIELFKT
jgi:hypothetical protein